MPFNRQPPLDRERLQRFLCQGEYDCCERIAFVKNWLAQEAGYPFATREIDSVRGLYDVATVWSEYGQLAASPVVPMARS